MSARIEICPGDLLSSGAPIIAHQVNCRGVMGAGVAKAIKGRYYGAYSIYRKRCMEKGAALMGTTQFVLAPDRTVIANCFAQNEIGVGRRQTDYDAFRSCMVQLRNFAEKKGIQRIAMPHKIGCGLAGGDWAIVHGIITEEFESFSGVVELWDISMASAGQEKGVNADL